MYKSTISSIVLHFTLFIFAYYGLPDVKKKEVKEIPIDKLLLETDTPYLAPVPLRGQDNRPNFIEHTAMKISNILDIDQKKLSEITISNSRRLLGRQS